MLWQAALGMEAGAWLTNLGDTALVTTGLPRQLVSGGDVRLHYRPRLSLLQGQVISDAVKYMLRHGKTIAD